MLPNNPSGKNKSIFTIQLINIWYVIITLIFILMRVTNIIDWSPLWILCPLWLPWAFLIGFCIIFYLLKGLVYLIDFIDKRKR